MTNRGDDLKEDIAEIKENLALYADTLKLDIDKRIEEEVKKIKTMANPEKEIERYFRHLRWRTPELAVYVRFQMLNILNLMEVRS